jgi:hypothetical protein
LRFPQTANNKRECGESKANHEVRVRQIYFGERRDDTSARIECGESAQWIMIYSDEARVARGRDWGAWQKRAEEWRERERERESGENSDTREGKTGRFEGE